MYKSRSPDYVVGLSWQGPFPTEVAALRDAGAKQATQIDELERDVENLQGEVEELAGTREELHHRVADLDRPGDDNAIKRYSLGKWLTAFSA